MLTLEKTGKVLEDYSEEVNVVMDREYTLKELCQEIIEGCPEEYGTIQLVKFGNPIDGEYMVYRHGSADMFTKISGQYLKKKVVRATAMKTFNNIDYDVEVTE